MERRESEFNESLAEIDDLGDMLFMFLREMETAGESDGEIARFITAEAEASGLKDEFIKHLQWKEEMLDDDPEIYEDREDRERHLKIARILSSK